MNNYYNCPFDEANSPFESAGDMNNPMNGPIRGPMNTPMNGPMNGPINGPMNSPMNSPMNPFPIKQMPSVPPMYDSPINPPIMPIDENLSPTIQSPLYTPGFLAKNIGKKMRVEFLIGSSGPLIDRIGTLVGVGISYILLKPINSNDVLLCDIYSIKFVSILI